LWLFVLLTVVNITLDSRVDVRNGAIQTVSRIFDNDNQDLSADNWYLCIHTILFGLLRRNSSIQVSLHSTESPKEKNELTAWYSTSKMVLETASNLLALCITTIAADERFLVTWDLLQEQFEAFLSCRAHHLNTYTYDAISTILSKVDESVAISPKAVGQITMLWMDYFPTQVTTVDVADTNQDAMMAYLKCGEQIYRLNQKDLKSVVAVPMIAHIQRAVEESDATAYSSDTDHATAVQTAAMNELRAIRTDVSGVLGGLLDVLAAFIVLPFAKRDQSTAPRRPTFVALSKLAMKFAEELTIRHFASYEVYASSGLHLVLNGLSKIIQLKYTWKIDGKNEPLWQRATTTALAITRPIVAHLDDNPLPKEKGLMLWDEIVKIAKYIAHAECEAASPAVSLVKDEDFDVMALKSLLDIAIPVLGSSDVPDLSRRSFTYSLFQSSLIHAPEPGEIPDFDEGPLQGLYYIRLGRTYDPVPNPRTNMALTCVSTLASLVSQHNGSAQRVRLAQAAAPYFILRAALPLKAYITDQPLRGKMPQPHSQRHELLFILRSLKELSCEPKAIPDAPGVTSATKKHLHRLYPLLNKATGVAGGDQEVLSELLGVLALVGEEFGI
jgi:hypothetical protein